MRKFLELVCQACNIAHQLVVLYIVISTLNMVSAHNLDLSDVLIALPLQEVDFLEQLLLMMLQVSHCLLARAEQFRVAFDH